MKIAYFKNGMLYDVSPRTASNLYEDREIAYKADVVVSDGISYDLENQADVANITIPAFSPTWDILELSYIMKIRCGAVNDPALLPIFVSKTLELMQSSGMLWRRRDYLQVIRNFYRCGLFELGDSFESEYRKTHPDIFINVKDVKHEAEHESTKRYFRSKWEKKKLK